MCDLESEVMFYYICVGVFRECCRFFGDDGLTAKVFFTKVVPFGLLWILINYLYLQALRKINTTDISALFCCNKAFVFLLSWIVLRDRFMGVRVSARMCRWTLVMDVRGPLRVNLFKRVFNMSCSFRVKLNEKGKSYHL